MNPGVVWYTTVITVVLSAALLPVVESTGRTKFATTISGLGTDALTSIVTAGDGSVFYSGSSSFAYYSSAALVDVDEKLYGRGDYRIAGPFNSSVVGGFDNAVGGCNVVTNPAGCPCAYSCTWVSKVSPTSGETLWTVDHFYGTQLQGMAVSRDSQFLYVVGEQLVRLSTALQSNEVKYTTRNVFAAKLNAATGALVWRVNSTCWACYGRSISVTADGSNVMITGLFHPVVPIVASNVPLGVVSKGYIFWQPNLNLSDIASVGAFTESVPSNTWLVRLSTSNGAGQWGVTTRSINYRHDPMVIRFRLVPEGWAPQYGLDTRAGVMYPSVVADPIRSDVVYWAWTGTSSDVPGRTWTGAQFPDNFGPPVGATAILSDTYEAYFVRYDLVTRKPLWLVQIGGPGDDGIRALTLNNNGSAIYVAGVSHSTRLDFRDITGGTACPAVLIRPKYVSSGVIFLAKYSSAGACGWTRIFGAGSSMFGWMGGQIAGVHRLSNPIALTVDTADDVFITMHSLIQNGVTLPTLFPAAEYQIAIEDANGWNRLTASLQQPTVVTVKLSPDSHLWWSHNIQSTPTGKTLSHTPAIAIAARNGMVYVGGVMHFTEKRTLILPDMNWTITSNTTTRLNPSGDSFFVGIREINDCNETNPCQPANTCRSAFVFGNTLCDPAFTSNTASVDSVPTQLQNLIIPDTRPQHLVYFTGRYFNSPIPNSVVLTFGPASNPTQFPCLSVGKTGVSESQTVACNLSVAVGVNLVFQMQTISPLPQIVANSQFVISYPPASIRSASLRTNKGSEQVFTVLKLADTSSVTLVMTGDNLVPTSDAANAPFPLSVWIRRSGLAPVRCTPAAITTNRFPDVYDTIECTSPVGLTGVNYQMSVIFDTQTLNGTDYLHLPIPAPAITTVSGCINSAVATRECSTTGGTQVTITGTSFPLAQGEGSAFPYSGALTLAVAVGGASCSNLIFRSPDTVTCDLPAGTGLNQPVVINAINVASPVLLISYAAPVIGSITAATCTSAGLLTLKQCQRVRTSLAITGSNFGVPTAANKPPVVFVGSLLCNITAFSPTLITCTIEPSADIDLPVTLFQNGGVSTSTTNATVPILSFVKCQPGTFQMTEPFNLTCQDCPPGRFTSQEGQTDACSVCISGSFQPFPKQAGCMQCPAGTFQASNLGATACQNCTTGSYSLSAGLSTCSVCLAGSFIANVSSSTPCSLCPPGYSQPANNASSCVVCQPGFFAVAPGSPRCDPCEKGSFSNTTGAMGCTLCLPGYIQSQTGQTACGACPRGTFAEDEAAIECLKCPASTYNNVNASTLCLPCPSGSESTAKVGAPPNVSPDGGSTGCSQCTNGTFSLSTTDIGTKECSKCPAGKYSVVNPMDGTGATDCIPCERGQMSSKGQGSDTCLDCPIGKYETGLIACLPCESGSYSNTSRSTACYECAPGYAQPVAEQSSCIACTPGRYADQPRTKACIDALPGYFSNGNASTIVAESCPQGSYTDVDRATACTPCPAGKTNSQIHQTECTPCTPGQFNPAGTTICLNCAPGNFSIISGALECQVCGLGTYQSLPGQTGCTLCAAGKFGNSTGATVDCYSCPVNTEGPSRGSSSCTTCTGATYTFEPGTTECQTCRQGFYYQRSNDICPSGTRFEKGDGCCLTCPSGADCDTKLQSRANYYLAADSSGTVTSVQCLPGYCLASNSEECRRATNTNSTTDVVDDGSLIVNCCGPNRAPAANNTFCAFCAPGYIEWNGSCIVCNEPAWGLLFLLFLASWVYVLGFHWISQAVNPDSRIFLNFVQMTLIFIANQEDAIGFLSVFSFNTVNSSGPRCIAPFTDTQRLFIPLIVPLIGLGQLGLTALITTSIALCSRRITACQPYAEKLSHPRFELDAYIRTIIATGLFSYKEIAAQSINFFDCQAVGDKYVIYQYPTIDCDGPTYRQLRPFFLFLVIAIVIGLPLVIFTFLLYNTLVGRLGRSPTFKLRYGILFEAYKANRFFYEVVVLGRRVIVLYVAMRLSATYNLQYTALSICNIIFLMLHVALAPYEFWYDNLSEEFSLIVLSITTLVLATVEQPINKAVGNGLAALIITTAGFFLIRVMFTRADRLATRLRSTLATSKGSKSEDSQSSNEKDPNATEAKSEPSQSGTTPTGGDAVPATGTGTGSGTAAQSTTEMATVQTSPPTLAAGAAGAGTAEAGVAAPIDPAAVAAADAAAAAATIGGAAPPQSPAPPINTGTATNAPPPADAAASPVASSALLPTGGGGATEVAPIALQSFQPLEFLPMPATATAPAPASSDTAAPAAAGAAPANAL